MTVTEVSRIEKWQNFWLGQCADPGMMQALIDEGYTKLDFGQSIWVGDLPIPRGDPAYVLKIEALLSFHHPDLKRKVVVYSRIKEISLDVKGAIDWGWGYIHLSQDQFEVLKKLFKIDFLIGGGDLKFLFERWPAEEKQLAAAQLRWINAIDLSDRLGPILNQPVESPSRWQRFKNFFKR